MILSKLGASLLRPGTARRVTVPRLVGLTVPEMWGAALRAGIGVKVHHVSAERPVAGRIVGQAPGPGTRVRRDAVVDLDVSFEEPSEGIAGPFG